MRGMRFNPSGDIIQDMRTILLGRSVETNPPSIPIKMFQNDYLHTDFIMQAVSDVERIVRENVLSERPITSLEKLGIILLAASADMDIFKELRDRVGKTT